MSLAQRLDRYFNAPVIALLLSALPMAAAAFCAG